MSSFRRNCEIVELKEDLNSVQHSPRVHRFKSAMRVDDRDRKAVLVGCSDSLEDDLNKLFAAINLKSSSEGMSPLGQPDTGHSKKNAQKQPLRAETPHLLGTSITEPVTLKQALRGLCISQASEMAAMKRASKPPGLGYSVGSDAGRIKNFHKSGAAGGREAGLPLNEGKDSKLELSLVPQESTSYIPTKIPEHLQLPKIKLSSKSAASSPRATSKHRSLTTTPTAAVPASIKTGSQTLKTKMTTKEKARLVHSPAGSSSVDKRRETSSNVPVSPKLPNKALSPKPVRKGQLQSNSSSSGLITSNKVIKSTSNAKPISSCKIIAKKKTQHDGPSKSSIYNGDDEEVSGLDPSSSQLICQRCQCSLMNASVESNQKYEASNCPRAEGGLINVKPAASKQGFTTNSCNSSRVGAAMVNKKAKPKEKIEFSQSSKSSLGEYSSSTSLSEDSNLSRPSCGNRPHMSKDVRWKAIRRARSKHRVLGLEHFNLLKKLGCGDIGTVYLAELIDLNCLFAIKVMDNEYLERRKKLPRAQTEREILRILDHPFLPTLYAQFTSDNLSCLVMEYCPGGDLHVLRQRQPGRNFHEQAARFYAAEVLLALEYLHMLGVVYRDLKPENILVREDGHIMLTDFDLSLRCSVSPTLLKSSSSLEPAKVVSGPCTGSSCIDPFCIEPSCQVPCFSPRFLPAAARARKIKADLAAQVRPLPQLVAEPTSARSNSFVGTHEYLAPEIIKGEGHGSAVDWWTYGVFLYELLYGKTPFKGSGNEETLANVVLQSLKFPDSPLVSFQARDLIRGLLMKDPEHRLGSERGAAEIKQHPFFQGLNWALIRCAIPPEIPEDCDFSTAPISQQSESKFLEYKPAGDHLEFELF